MAGDDDLPIVDFNRLVKKALNNIYHKRGGVGDIDPALFELNNTPLQKGIDKTFGSAGVEFGKKNKVFIDQFKHNTSIFVAFKTHKQGDELAKLMLDEKGNQRSFSQFERASQPLIGAYNRRYLKTEYDTFVRSARMATNWKKFEERKHIFPNIEFMLSRARDKRPEHLRYVGTILPMEHPWWRTHTPPISWGCECWIRQTREAVKYPEGYTDEDIDNEIPEAFQNNPGITGEPIALDKHPYITESNISKEQIQNFVIDNSSSQQLEYVRQENIGVNNGYLDIHTLADTTPGNRVVGEILANLGYKVRLLPDIQPQNIQLRNLFMPSGIKLNKSPDAMIGGRIFEFKNIEANSYNAISQELRKAGKQANYVLLHIKGQMDDNIINRAIRGRVKNKKDIQEVWLVKDGYLKKYNREFILGDDFNKKSKALH